MDYSLPGSSVHGISQTGILESIFPSPGDLPDPGMEPTSPALAGKFFTAEPPGNPPIQFSRNSLNKTMILSARPFQKIPFHLFICLN